MKLKSSLTLFIAMAALAGLSLGANAQETESGQSGTFVLAIHGGDGVRDRDQMTPEMETAYRDALKQSLEAGYKVLNDGGSSVAAVEAAIMVMEDSPHD